MTTAPGAAPVRSRVAERLAPFGTTIFAEMTALAQQHGAVNLSQGFPDFDGPGFVKDAAARAMGAGENQYARMLGVPALNRAVADWFGRATGLEVDPDAQVQVTSGCTEALAAAFLGLVNPGDEVVLFEPYYDSYRACAAMAGAEPKFVALRAAPMTPSASLREAPPTRAVGEGAGSGFAFDEAELRAAFGPRTRAVLVNTPHNPTGKVFTRAELEVIAKLCVEHDVIAITDEVYERLVFEPSRPHVSLASLPGMAERTVVLSSLGKTFSLTGWKIGWAVGPASLIRGVRAAHQFLTFATATPLQHGAAVALSSPEGEAYVAGLVGRYREAREFLCGALEEIGFGVHRPEGTYFVTADHSRFGFADDVSFCRHLTAEIGVAAIPPSVFYSRPELGRSLVRFAFCKKRETLERAVERLARLKG